MPHKLFQVSAVNPNDNSGGGGCVCDSMKQIDCRPPFIVIPGNDMESYLSPHVVICQACAEYMVEKLNGEVLEAGERGVTFNHEAPQHQVVQSVVGTDPWPAVQAAIVADDDDDIPEV